MSAVGIDLGASATRVAMVREGSPRLIADEDGRQDLPSVVAPGPHGLVVGHEARIMSGAQHSLWALNRGRALADPEHTQQAVAALIAAAAERARRMTSAQIDEAVIAIPADLDGPGRRMIRAAGRSVGVEVIRLMRAGTAAALSQLSRWPAPGIFAVLDFGTSRFDVTLFSVTDDTLSVLAAQTTAGVGGADLDRALAEILMEQRRPWADLSQAARDRAIAGARRTRELLSDRYVAPLSCVLDDGPPLRHPVSRDQMESALAPWLDQIHGPCREAMLQADVRPGALDAVYLVGGMAPMPLLRTLARDVFQVRPTVIEASSAAVVKGAAIQADLMAGADLSGVVRVLGRQPLVIEGAPWDLGLESADGSVEILIPQNAPLPTSCTRRFTTWRDDQQRLDIPLVLGSGDPRWLCCEGLRPAPAGKVEVEAHFALDPDGVLSWSARQTDEPTRPLAMYPVTSVALSVSGPDVTS